MRPPAIQTLLLPLLLLLAGVVLPTEATKDGGSSANTTLQAQPGRHHVQKVSYTHTEWMGEMAAHVGYTDLYTICLSTVVRGIGSRTSRNSLIVE